MSIPGVEPVSDAPVVREFAVRAPLAPELIVERLLEKGFLAGIPLREGFEGTPVEGGLLVAVTERRTAAQIDGFAAAFAEVIR